MKTQRSYFAIITFMFLLSGCGRSSINKNQFAIISPEKISKQPQQLDMVIEVRLFSINPLFSSKQFVYRVSEFRYVQDYYNEFLISPAVMITEAAGNWLSQTGMFVRVLGPGSAMSPSYIIEGSISQCYADIRDKNAPAAVLKMQVFLIKRDNNVDSLQWSKTYDTSRPMKDRSGESFIEALNRCLQNGLQKMQTDITAM